MDKTAGGDFERLMPSLRIDAIATLGVIAIIVADMVFKPFQ